MQPQNDDILKVLSKIDELITNQDKQTELLDDLRSRLPSLERRMNMFISMEQKIERNAQALNSMLLELKGIVATVRPQVRKTGWYGEEIIDPKKCLEKLFEVTQELDI